MKDPDIFPKEIAEIFLSLKADADQRSSFPDLRYAHYTSASVAMSIIQKKKLWMRKTSCMNDWAELAHGLELLRSIWKTPLGQRFRCALDAIHPETSKSVEAIQQLDREQLPSGIYL